MITVNNFCTIITASYVDFAKVLNESLLEFSNNVCFTVLIVDRNSSAPVIDFAHINNIDVIYFDQLLMKCDFPIALTNIILDNNSDKLRWTLKPTLLKYLVLEKLKPVIYLDADLFFINPFEFLFDYFNNADFLLSPHFRSISPSYFNKSFEKVFTQGFFNAGFVGATHGAVSILEWWEEACIFKCEKNELLGYYDDQRYLDLIPIFFDNVAILKHQGCNVASWNIDVCIRSSIKNTILINNLYPIVFIHFSRDTCEQIIFGSDNILMPILEKYAERTTYYNPKLKFLNDIRKVHHDKLNYNNRGIEYYFNKICQYLTLLF